MNRTYVIPGFILLLLAFGAGHADEISSSIVSDGATWVSSSVLGPDRSHASSLFTSDVASLLRTLHPGGDLQVFTSGESSEPMGIMEYSEILPNVSGERQDCIFGIPENVTIQRSEILSSGLLSGGSYVSSKRIEDLISAGYMVNGSGIVLTRAESDDGDRTVSFGSDIAGRMNVSERMVLG